MKVLYEAGFAATTDFLCFLDLAVLQSSFDLVLVFEISIRKAFVKFLFKNISVACH